MEYIGIKWLIPSMNPTYNPCINLSGMPAKKHTFNILIPAKQMFGLRGVETLVITNKRREFIRIDQ